MPATTKTRKPVNELSVGDLQTFPIWEFVTDEEGVEGQDETWVRPVRGSQIPMGAYSQLVAADFVTAGGVQLQGFMTVTTAEGIEITPGSLVGEGLYQVLPVTVEEQAWKEARNWAVQSCKQVLEALGRPGTSVFQ